MLALGFLVVAVALPFVVSGLGGAGRYRDDACPGPAPYTSDCADAFSAMVFGGVALLVAAILIGLIVWRYRRRAAQLRQMESLRTQRRAARIRRRSSA